MVALNWEATGWMELTGRVAADVEKVGLFYGSAEVSVVLPTNAIHHPKSEVDSRLPACPAQQIEFRDSKSDQW